MSTEDQGRTPSLALVLRAAFERRLTEVHTAIPGRVESYDAAKQVADVQPLVQQLVPQEGGGTSAESLPVLIALPVGFPGGGGMRIVFPLKKGDTGLIHFTETSLDVWQAKGGLVDPGDPRRFHLADAVFYPGLHADDAPWTGANTDDASFGKDGAHQVVITPNNIELGGNDSDRPGDFVALSSLVKNELQRRKDWEDGMKSTFDGHKHSVSGIKTTGSPAAQSQTLPVDSAAPSTGAPTPGAVGDVKSAIVKSK